MFEVFAAILTFNQCRMTLKDGAIKGVSIVSTVLVCTWGVYGFWYYYNLNQWYSLAGNIILTLSNVVWVCLMIYYRVKQHDGFQRTTRTKVTCRLRMRRAIVSCSETIGPASNIKSLREKCLRYGLKM